MVGGGADVINRFLRWYLGGLAELAAERADRKREEAARIRNGVVTLNIVRDREIMRRELLRAALADDWARWWQDVAELVPGRWRR